MEKQNKIAKTNQDQAMILGEKRQKDLALFSPKNCFQHSHKLKTVKDVLSLPSKSLGDFKRSYGKDWVIGYISMWLIDLNDNSNVKTKMNDAQVEFTAERIYESYSLKVTDLTLFFRNVKEGVYGSYYENLSQEKILQWLREYFNLRCEYAEMHAQQNHEGFSMAKDKIDPEVAKKMRESLSREKVEHEHQGNGMGSRMESVLTAKIGEEKVKVFKEVKGMTDKQLKDYLVNADVNSEDFDAYFYHLAEAEIDYRNKNKS